MRDIENLGYLSDLVSRYRKESHNDEETLKVNTTLVKGLLQYGVENEIDFSSSQETPLDHAYMVPLSFVTPQMDLPIVPLHVGGMLAPAPTSRRCFKVRKNRRLYSKSL